VGEGVRVSVGVLEGVCVKVRLGVWERVWVEPNTTGGTTTGKSLFPGCGVR